PASRSAELIRQMTALGLEPKRMQWVHSREGEEARLVLVEGSKQAGSEVRVLPPLFIYDSEGKYTPAAGELFS
ncbi:MAG TPA: SAM-dependent methyltransferase, partial [Thermodesulfobacteriota bacterium]|nr:SAM-dependent methyltransferase [Thermodesulfobacteriota bacterium]